MQGQDNSPSHKQEQPGSGDRTAAMTGGANEKEKTKPSPSGEEAMPGGQPATPTPPG